MEERNQPRRPRRDAEQPQQKSESLIYGKNPVTELLKSGSGVDTVLIAEGMAPAVAAYYTARKLFVKIAPILFVLFVLSHFGAKSGFQNGIFLG